MHIIPAIDIIDGKCVRLTQGDYAQKTEYASDPLIVAQKFEAAGIKRLHVVDLDGAKASKIVNEPTLKRIASNTSLHVDFGGGVKSDEAIDMAFAAGAAQITAGSIAVNNKPLVLSWLKKYGTSKIILGADVHHNEVRINGWQEGSGMNIFDFLEDYVSAGIEYVICTDVSKDGLLQGPSFDLYDDILKRYPKLKLIASGGVAELDDLKKLEQAGMFGTIVGKAYYEGRISLEELASFEQTIN
ncbi:1-(5-phosphoribosyl)-5-[(5-phosphoribosylamino)methylideneamino] imidazole-4-carboxamide isomerase [Roseivirga seohaensis subsp. aquiponti]|uniref:1-(5-phosphoribosyl)-5-[(5-phosphoribosylamino)methylideneamino] imidazole-4-carboxamide isomerase n=1 Tax=Roseivirga seohaensis subsp. aquiponti TaxID=1566026 RepID=A0A0L8AQJ9_9BACT|nr:1-(5-phosphoribosyl)-5-[(5-phosphoribosylamino)methylideneamino]imidazole-4-carboxamide isomerase [Roseivirga seohaensis]KOF04467.1 1-(5-phosphoribosyl)-5-[(5-phosphoribosylamino)methylideneamino] imidazole-4-carboxamide isomerase [Roseivirga seohaensis subsp. aquiponti]